MVLGNSMQLMWPHAARLLFPGQPSLSIPSRPDAFTCPSTHDQISPCHVFRPPPGVPFLHSIRQHRENQYCLRLGHEAVYPIEISLSALRSHHSTRMDNNESGFQSNKQMGPWVNATHPGGVSTDQQDQAVEACGKLGKLGVAVVRPLLKDPMDEGCRSALFTATSDDFLRKKIQGQYVSRARASRFNSHSLVA